MSYTMHTLDLGDGVAIDCDTCGALGIHARPDASVFIYDHLKIAHDCDMSTVDIRHLTPPTEES